MGLAEDVKALQELREKGELSESAYAAARDTALGKHAQPATTPNVKSLLSTPTRVFLGIVVLFVGFGIFANIYDKTSKGHQPRTSRMVQSSGHMA